MPQGLSMVVALPIDPDRRTAGEPGDGKAPRSRAHPGYMFEYEQYVFVGEHFWGQVFVWKASERIGA